MMLMSEAFIAAKAGFKGLDGFSIEVDRPSSSYHSVVLKRNNIKISFNIEEIEWYASVVVERVQGDATEFYCALTSGDYHRDKGKTCGISEAIGNESIETQIRDWYSRQKRAHCDSQILADLMYTLVIELLEHIGEIR